MKRIIAVSLVLLICLIPIFGLCEGYVENVSIYDVENNVEEFRVYAGFFDEQNKSIGYIDEIKADINGMPIEVKYSDVISETEEGTAILFLVDVSGSVKGKAFDAIESSMIEWIDNMGFFDQYAIVSFGEKIEEVCYFTYDDDELLDAVDSLKPNEKYTRLNQALYEGLSIYSFAYDEVPQRRVMVMLSDGKNETKNEQDATDSEVLSILKQEAIPVYALGCNYTNKKENEKYLMHMQNIANVSNGRYYDIEDLSAIDDVYYDLRDDVNNTFVIDLAFYEDTVDFKKSDEYILTLTGVTGTSEASGLIEIKLDDEVVQKLMAQPAKTDESAQSPTNKPTLAPANDSNEQHSDEQQHKNILVEYWWAFIGLLLLILVLLLLLLLLKNKNSNDVQYNVKAVGVDDVKTDKNLSRGNIAKPIDPSFVDDLRDDSIQKTVSDAHEKAMLITMQMPKQKKIEKEIMISEIIKLGNDEICDIMVADDSIPKCALNIIYRDGYMYISKVSNDVEAYINGMEMSLEVPLKNGDLINIGNALIKVYY